LRSIISSNAPPLRAAAACGTGAEAPIKPIESRPGLAPEDAGEKAVAE